MSVYAGVEFEAQGGEGPPLVYVPQFRYPNGAKAFLDGEPAEITVDPASQRAVDPWQGQPGRHLLRLSGKE